MLAEPIATVLWPLDSEAAPIATAPYSVARAATPSAVLSCPDAVVDQVSSSQVSPLITVICPPMAVAPWPVAWLPTP